MICGSCSPLAQFDQLLQDREPIEARHLHVEKHHVRVMSADQIDGLDAVLSFRENFDRCPAVSSRYFSSSRASSSSSTMRAVMDHACP